MSKAIAVIPTLNEYKNVKVLLEEFLNFQLDVIFIDDNSSDQTQELIQEHPLYNSKYFLIKRKTKLGYASACIRGLDFARERKYKTVIQMDADLSHSCKDLKYLLDSYENENADVIIGSRYIQNGSIDGWGFYRKYLSLFANFVCSKILKIGIHDYTSGFRVYRNEALYSLEFEKITVEGYSFLVEVIYRIHKNNFQIIEKPIIFKDRLNGKSKLSKKIIFESVFNLLKLRFKK
tara:strand:+ start:13630 stop:14331 length:702 start_codon:yes stop_codon:yes gene_type:complete